MKTGFDPNVYIQMGYSEAEIKQAHSIATQKKIDIFDALQMLQQQQSPTKGQSLRKLTFLTPISSIKVRQYEVIYSKKIDRNSFILKQQVRDPTFPIGLLNVSNCCYLNSLLQCYFLMPDFVKQILVADPIQNIDERFDHKIKLKRIKNQFKFLQSVKNIFQKMALSSKKYLDPEPVLKNLVDSVGQKVSYGEQKDLFEINMQIIERLSQCIMYTKKYYKQQGEIESVIKKMFYGTKVQYLEQSEDLSEFMGIIINPIHQNLMKALDQQFHYEVLTAQGKQFKKHTYIRTEPEYMFFYINRINYDKEDHLALKNQAKLSFEFQIYLDRYLERYKEASQVNNPMIQRLLSEKNNVISQINHLDALTAKLAECRQHAQHIQGWKQNLPSEEQLIKFKESLKQKLQEIEKQLQKIQSRRQKYELVYIFVHRGDAISGHYWGYGKVNNYWVRFDINTKKLKQQQLLSEMEQAGGTPYSLVYAKEQKIPKISYMFHTDYTTNLQACSYLKLIPENIRKQICQQNVELQKNAIARSQFLGIQNTISQYKTRYQVVKNIIQQSNKQSKFKIPTYENFSCYLYSKQQYQLAKYNIFSIALKVGAHTTPTQLIKNDRFLNLIQKSFKKRVKNQQALRHFAIQGEPTQCSNYNQLYTNFVIERRIMKLISSIKQALEEPEGNIEQFFPQICKYLTNSSYLGNILKQITTLLILKESKTKVIPKQFIQFLKQWSNQVYKYVDQLNKFNGDLKLQAAEEVQTKNRDIIWRIEDTKKYSLSSRLQNIVKICIKQLGQELKIAKDLRNQNIFGISSHSQEKKQANNQDLLQFSGKPSQTKTQIDSLI